MWPPCASTRLWRSVREPSRRPRRPSWHGLDEFHAFAYRERQKHERHRRPGVRLERRGEFPDDDASKLAVEEDPANVPANYTEGEGVIVAGTTADQATDSALASYPGVVVDRVVQLTVGDSGTDYEAHCMSVNWPHHIFVNQDINFLGAD